MRPSLRRSCRQLVRTPHLALQLDCVDIVSVWPGEHAHRNKDPVEELKVLQGLNHGAGFGNDFIKIVNARGAIREPDAKPEISQDINFRDVDNLDHSTSAPGTALKG